MELVITESGLSAQDVIIFYIIIIAYISDQIMIKKYGNKSNNKNS